MDSIVRGSVFGTGNRVWLRGEFRKMPGVR